MKYFRLGYSVGNLLLPFILSSIALTSCKKNHTAIESQDKLAPSNSAQAVIQIGEIGSLTGSEATFGISTHQGIELAIQEVNSEGGINNKKLNVITLDDQSKPEEAATAAIKLVTQYQVSALLGEVASSRSMAMAAIAQDNKIPMITPSSTNPKVTQQGDYIFRVCFIDPFQGEVMAKFSRNQLKAKKVAILRDLKSDYSTGLSQFYKSAFLKEGGQIVLDETYNSGDIDFKSQLTHIRSYNPDAIFVPGYYTEVGLIARQARELGIQAPLLGGDGWDSPKLVEIGGQSIENSYFSNHYSSENQAPQVQSFIARFKQRYGVVPDGLAAMGYDAAKVLSDAMKRAKSLSTADIRNALATTKAFPGVTGVITIDKDRNAVKSAVILKVVKNGYFKYQTTIHP